MHLCCLTREESDELYFTPLKLQNHFISSFLTEQEQWLGEPAPKFSGYMLHAKCYMLQAGLRRRQQG